MNRKDFIAIAKQRLEESTALLAVGHAPGAYYLVGYAVECGLKAAIAKKTTATEFPPDRRVIDRYYSHKLSDLVKAAGLELALQLEANLDPLFGANWGVAATWSEQSRYDLKTLPEATELHTAITDLRHGVMRWVRRHW